MKKCGADTRQFVAGSHPATCGQLIQGYHSEHGLAGFDGSWAMGAVAVLRAYPLLEKTRAHAVGDDTLSGIERRLHARLRQALPCRPTDLNWVCRVGGQ